MKILTKNEHLCIRKMMPVQEDFLQRLTWMTDPDVLEYWDGDYDYDGIAAAYYEGLQEGVTPCFIELDGCPIGYVQFERIPNAAGYECPEGDWKQFIRPEDTVYGIDMFLAKPEDRGRGLGTEMLRLLSKALFEKYGADVLVVDPKTHNARAIACYRKSGFTDCFVVPQREAHFGELFDSLIMYRRKLT